MSKLAKRAEAQDRTIKRQRKRLSEVKGGTPWQLAWSVAGAAAAGALDRPGAMLGIPDEIPGLGLPTTAAVGAALAVSAVFWTRMPFRDIAGPLGQGIICGLAYDRAKNGL